MERLRCKLRDSDTDKRGSHTGVETQVQVVRFRWRGRGVEWR